MKQWIRLSTTLGVVGATFASALFAFAPRALALTEAQILEKLAPVPVFTITDEKGAPLVKTVPVGENAQNPNNVRQVAVAGVFIKREDAEAFFANLKKASPEIAKDLKVVPVSLGTVYESAKRARAERADLVFDFVPDEEQLKTALSLINQERRAENKQPLEAFNGVPLFAARGGDKGGYLTVENEGKTVIPFFFSKEELQPMIDRFKADQPDLADTVTVEVLDLEGVIATFQATQKKPDIERDKQLNLIFLIPHQDSFDE